jgi:PAS domain S-box-containing protein
MLKAQNAIRNPVWSDLHGAPVDYRAASSQRRLSAPNPDVDGNFLHHALNEHAIVSMADVKGNIISVNDKFVEISGYSRKELIGQNHRMLKSNEHTKTFYRDMWHNIASGISWTGEIKNLKKNGDPYWVKASIVPYLNDAGKPVQYLSIRTDITAVKAAESLKQQRLAFDAIQDEIYMFWPDTLKFFYANTAAREKSGFNDDILNRSPMTVSPTALTEKDLRDKLKPLTNGEKDHVTYFENRTAENGEETSFEITVQLIEPTGKKPHFISIIRDISERKRAQDKLRLANQRFSDFAQSGSDWFWELDEAFGFANIPTLTGDPVLDKCISQNLGRTPWEVIGVDLDADEHWRKHVEDMKSHRTFRDFRYSLRDSLGKVRNLSISGKPFFKTDGTFLGYRGTSVDMTGLVQCEAVNERFLDAVDHLQEGLALWDQDEKLLVCSKFMRERAGSAGKTIRIGMTFEQLLGQHVRMGLIPEAVGRENEWIATRLLEFRNPAGTIEMFRNERWYSLTFSKLPDGSTMQVISDIHDLKMSEHRFEAATAEAGVGVWESPADRSSSIWSESYYALLGISPNSVEPSLENFLATVYPDDREGVENVIDNSGGNSDGYSFECRIQKPNGDTIWVRNSGKLMGVSGAERWFGSLVDIDQQKRASIVKSEFISTMNHELRTPLTSVLGALDIVRSGALGELNPKMSKILTLGKRNADRLLALVNDTLDFEKLETDHFAFCLEPMSVHEVLSNAVQINALFAEQNGTELKLSPCKQSFEVMVDHKRVQQVFTNLISNAVKFSSDGTPVEISAEIDGKFSVFRVKDHGRGISQEFRPKLFDRFTQEDSSDTRSKGGTGLGLAISKSLIEGQGGTIDFDSELGVGTTFSVSLPLAA